MCGEKNNKTRQDNTTQQSKLSRRRAKLKVNLNLQAASNFAAFVVFFVRNHTATEMFLAVEGAARIFNATKTFF